MELIIDDLSKKFKDKEAVSHVSLKLTPGVWGLLGANGRCPCRRSRGYNAPTCGILFCRRAQARDIRPVVPDPAYR